MKAAKEARVNGRKHEKNRRQWVRLALAIPVFVRCRNHRDKDFLEFASAVNIGGGGALVVLRRSLPEATPVSLEIPTAPLATTAALPKSSRILRAKTVHVTHAEGYHLVGVKFAQPLAPTLRKNHRSLAES